MNINLVNGGEAKIALAGADAYRLVVSGELTAGAKDHRFLLRLDDKAAGYQSFAVMWGHAHVGEWDGTGFYVGRNGWGLDADVSIEYTISAATLTRRRVGHGMATFALGNNNILGYTCHGFLVSDSPLASVSLVVTGGQFRGRAHVERIDYGSGGDSPSAVPASRKKRGLKAE